MVPQKQTGGGCKQKKKLMLGRLKQKNVHCSGSM